MIRSFTIVALMCVTSGEAATARGYSTVRPARTSKRCGFMEVWGDLGRRTQEEIGRRCMAVLKRYGAAVE